MAVMKAIHNINHLRGLKVAVAVAPTDDEFAVYVPATASDGITQLAKKFPAESVWTFGSE